MAKVEIYTKNNCPFCHAAKNLLEERGVEYTEYNAENDETLREEMLQRSNGRKTFPEIFINQEHVGGYDDLKQLDDEGGLDKLLNEG